MHGCFWHRHPGCKYAYTPKSRVDFWTAKFDGNVERDARAAEDLRGLGWKVIVIWECECADLVALEQQLASQIEAAGGG